MTFLATPSTTAFRALAAALPGRVHLPDDPDWAAHRMAWAVAVDQQPIAVVDASSADDVVATVRFAAEHGLTVAAQPVGHGATTALTGTIVLRTRGIQHVHVDPEARIARVGAGVKWGEALAAIAPHGLTGLAGSSSDPSVVGFTVSGGLSWFGRSWGLAAASVRALDIVDATGTLRRISKDHDPDLFWAICGGGGDFAVVTAMEFALHPAPHVYGGRMMWPLEMAQPVLRAFQQVTQDAPDELTLWTHLFRFPPLPDLPEFLQGKQFVSIEATYVGSAEQAEALLAPFREIPALHIDTMGTVPVDKLSDICAEPTDPMPTIEWSGLLTDFGDEALQLLLAEVGHQAPSPLFAVQIRHLGGALARGSVADGPIGALPEPYQLFALGVPATPELAAALEVSIAGLQVAMDGHLSGRTFFTFLCSDSDPSRSFAPGSLEQLQVVKRAVDPNGVIRSNRPVLPLG